MPDWSKFYLDVLMHMAFLSLILTFVFFVVIVPTERDALRGEITHAIRENIEQALLQDKNKQLLQSMDMSVLEQMLAISQSQSTVLTDLANARTFTIALLFSTLMGSLFVTNYLVMRLGCTFCRAFFALLIENIITFAFVGFIEFLFFMNVAKAFAPSPPSFLASYALKAILKSIT